MSIGAQNGPLRVVVVLWRRSQDGKNVEFFVPVMGPYLTNMSHQIAAGMSAAESARIWLQSEWNVSTRANARTFVRDGGRRIAVAFNLSNLEQQLLAGKGTWWKAYKLSAVRHPGTPTALLNELSTVLSS